MSVDNVIVARKLGYSQEDVEFMLVLCSRLNKDMGVLARELKAKGQEHKLDEWREVIKRRETPKAQFLYEALFEH